MIGELTPLPDPVPGLERLRRRLAGRDALRDDLLARLAQTPTPAGLLGDQLDVAGDPDIVLAAQLWARVADGVCAYTELTAGETYLGTAQDWTDVRRVAALTGQRPSQRTAASGWIRIESAPGAEPLVAAGTQVQAPAAGSRPSQTFEVVADVRVRAEWADLTVTAVPEPVAPQSNRLRFLSDPGFRPSDRVVLVAEGGAGPPVPMPPVWGAWLIWIGGLSNLASTSTTIQGVVRVTGRSDDLGSTLIEADRNLEPLLRNVTGRTYAAYRVRAELTVASRLEQLSYIEGNVAKVAAPSYVEIGPYDDDHVVLVNDGSAVSPEQRIILHRGSACVVTTVSTVTPLDWHVTPGTTRRVTRLGLTDSIAAVNGPGLAALLVDERRVAQHYELPALDGAVSAARIHPRPAVMPERIAVRTTTPNGTTRWELTRVTPNALDSPDDAGGILVNLTDPRTGQIDRALATGNVAPIRHGSSSSGPLKVTGGVAVIDGPVTADASTDGTVTDSLVVMVDGVRWDEVPSLFGRRPGELVYTTKLAAQGQLVVQFGDGVTGARPRGAVEARWRTGGGLEGELDGAQITVLTGSITGVRSITGAGPTSGAADQDDAGQLKRVAPARIRALDRAVALGDLADLALTMPGTSHAVSWRGVGPPGCGCGRAGLHVAVLRRSSGGVRPPDASELLALSRYLDARRDPSVPVCVAAAVSTPLTAAAQLAIDPRRDPAAVLSTATTAALDPGGPLAPSTRSLGTPLDGSDVIEVIQPVTGVIGITDLSLTGSTSAALPGDLLLGRHPAARYELLWIADAQLRERAHG